MNKAFTLIELLTVIAILAIILFIAVPKVLDTINSSKKASFSASAQLFAKAGNNYLYDNWDTIAKPISGTGLVVTASQLKSAGYIKSISEISNSVIVIYNNNSNYEVHSFVTDGKHIVDGYTEEYIEDNVRTGSINYASLVTSSTTYCSSGSKLSLSTLDTSCASAPELASNMIPIYYDGTVWKKADLTNLSSTYKWYDYTNKMWANAVTVTSAKLITYQNAVVGTTILEADILTYMVWIPRYKYAIPTGTGARSISIVFENSSTTKSTGTATNTSYYTHPVFTFGTKELNGIWFSKFELTGSSSATTVKPNLVAFRSQSVSEFFTLMRNMETSTNKYGYVASEVDTHMMKNSEWGAVAYLSYSIYGFNQEPWSNPNSSNTTGYAGTAVDSANFTAASCFAYNTATGMNASTTGNIYGIYDMSGASWEYTMGNYSNYSGNSITANSGFNGLNGGDSSTTVGIAFPNSKYYDLYTTSVNTTACNGGICYGHAMSETNSWNSDYSSAVGVSYPWFMRGGHFSNTGAGKGIFAYSASYYGNASSGASTRW